MTDAVALDAASIPDGVEPDGVERSVDAFQLAGSSEGEFVAGLGGRAAIALGVLLLSLVVLPSHVNPARLLIGGTGAFALVTGVVLVRMSRRAPLVVLDGLLVFTDGLLVLLGQFGGPLAPAFPGMYLVIGTIVFAGRPWSVVTFHVALLGASYAGVLAVGPPHFAPLTRWIAVMTVLITTGVFLRWLVATVAGLAVAEHTARDVAEAATIELERVSQAKSVFLARMSHELRTPLNVVLGFADLLGEQRVGPLNSRQQDYVRDISESARHLVALVDDVLDMATVESGGVRINAVLFDVRDVLTDSVTLVRHEADRKALTIGFGIAPDVGAVEGDRLKVRQTVVNLLANAVKFTPNGGTITVRAGTVGDRVHVSVEDTGIGISAHDLDRIFEEYAQSARGHGGTGLGLPLARRFVELHGGRMWVESTRGSGSVFHFELPRRPESAAVTPSPLDVSPLEPDHSAFTKPGSAANRALIGRIATRLVVIGGLLTVVLAAVTPTDSAGRLSAAAGGAGIALGAGLAGRHFSRFSFRQVEWAGWFAVVGLSVLTYFAGPFAPLAPLAYGWVTMVAVALWPRRRALVIVVGVALSYGVVLAVQRTPDAVSHWLAMLTLLTFNSEIVSWVTGRLRRMVVAEQTAHRGAKQVEAQLKATSRHKSAFVANMSHELRTPLNAVIGFADLLDSGLVGPLNDRQREYIRDVQESARHLLTIINEVLDSAKLEAGQMQLQLDVIPMRALFETVVARASRRTGAQMRGVRLDVSPDVDFVVADRERIQQVLVELVSNAVKFTPDGGHVEVAARPAPDGMLHISITDSGVGILPDQVECIFEPFQQGTRHLNHHVPTGTGLGLSLAQSLVELHGGRIRVVSEPDHGSTFTVELPILMSGTRSVEAAARVTG